jgi:hypothetical protein
MVAAMREIIDWLLLALFGTTSCQYRFLQADIHSLSLRRSGHSISLQNSRSLKLTRTIHRYHFRRQDHKMALVDL